MSEIVIGFHFYQPPREACHKLFTDISTDPFGVNWTRRIDAECYSPLAKLGVLNRATYDLLPTLDVALEDIDPEVVSIMRGNMAANGIASPFIHALLPDLSHADKRIVIGAGIKRFVDITGKKPRFFWPPETAIDSETLKVLIENGIEGFLCSPNQIQLNGGEDANNMPTRIRLDAGDILAMPYDRDLSHKLAFEDDPNDLLRADAYKFTHRVVIPALDKLRNGCPLVGWTDGETYGHHMPFGAAFIASLLNHALPDCGISPISINQVDLSGITSAEGRIRERTAWSCPHDNLARWHGECCCSGTNEGWKPAFNSALTFLNEHITGIVAAQLGQEYGGKMIDNFDKAFRNPGPPSSTPELSLISSKVCVLTALTSCATFFGDPHASGKINLLHTRVGVEHLKDAGFGAQAETLWGVFMNLMRDVWDPTQPGKTGFDIISNLLGDRIYVRV